MATETSTTVDIFGLTEWNEMIKVASVVPPPPALVGGTISYIDDTADGVYEFFDSDGNVIESVGVGDKPYAYKIVTPGTKDKYYVYRDELYDFAKWTYYKDGSPVEESLSTSDALGTGKTNTEIVMTKDNGAYITADSNGLPTIWYQLQQARLAKVGGCDDWFVPSMNELEELRLATASGAITGGTIAGSSYRDSVFQNSFLWVSSETSGSGAWFFEKGAWISYYPKVMNACTIFIRAF